MGQSDDDVALIPRAALKTYRRLRPTTSSSLSRHWRCELTGDDPVTRYEVRAVRWEHGWELDIDGVGVTQSEGLNDAERTAVELIARCTGTDPADVTVNLIISSA